MRKILSYLTLLLVISFQPAIAQDITISVDGEPFTNKFVGAPLNGDKLQEFVREGETFDKWTKLVGFRYQQLPGLGNDPKKVAISMDQVLKMTNQKARSKIIFNEQSSEAMIDFLTWPKDGEYMEFNIFRYIKSTDGKAIVSLQLAYRFSDRSAEGLEKFKKLRESWIKQAAGFDMEIVHAVLNQ